LISALKYVSPKVICCWSSRKKDYFERERVIKNIFLEEEAVDELKNQEVTRDNLSYN